MKKLLFFIPVLMIAMVSCQKEIDWELGNYGDLVAKIEMITPATNDTNIRSFQWDAAGRLTSYRSTGEQNNIPVDFIHNISRGVDGRITRIHSESSLLAGFIDSIAYFPFYQPNGSRLSYVIDSQYTVSGTIMDSMTYTYNGTGEVILKETFSGLPGLLMPTRKQVFTYDGNGNLTVVMDSIPDGSGGYDLQTITTNTFDSHGTIFQLGEEAFIVPDLDAMAVSKNNSPKQTRVDPNFAGNSYTITGSQYQFNAADCPVKFSMGITPQPPGFDMKLIITYRKPL